MEGIVCASLSVGASEESVFICEKRGAKRTILIFYLVFKTRKIFGSTPIT